MGNPKKMSKFICLKHCGENHVLDGLQRGGHQREKKHIKDAFCIECQDITKNLEVRWCDDYKERMEWAIEICGDFYDSEGNYIGKYDPECMPLELRKAN